MSKGNISTVAGRAALPVHRSNVHWQKRATGRFIGYRKTAADTGSWWARLRDDDGTQRYQRLGAFDDLPQGQRFDAATKAADEWFRQYDSGVRIERKMTVRAVCERHAKALRADGYEKKALEHENRYRQYVYNDPIADIELVKLKKAHLEDWRRRLAAMPARVWRRKIEQVKPRNRPGLSETAERNRSPVTVDRDIVCVRSALNRAYDDGLVASDLAWRVALRASKHTGKRRDRYIDRDERTRMLAAASGEICPFLRGLSTLPLRPGALAALTVGDFDARRRTLRVGLDKTGADRRIGLPPQTVAFLAEQAKDKLPAAPLFSDALGRRWTKTTWNAPIKAAMQAAGLPVTATAYLLRHAAITDLVTAGLPLLTVAQISGTSVAMIEKHYGHLQQGAAAEALATLALDR